jgi:hypothetical protein
MAAYLEASQKAVNAYNKFSDGIKPAGQAFDDIALELNRVVVRIHHVSAPVETLARELDQLISRADANESRLRAIVVDNPDLRNAGNLLCSAQAHHARALKSLRSFVKVGDERYLHGPEGYEAHLDSGSRDIRFFREQCDKYLKAHELIRQSP